MQQKRLAVFAYNFPHKKTQDFLTHLFMHGYEGEAVIAADPVKLTIPPSSIRSQIRHGAIIHPRDVSRRIGANYYVTKHNSEETCDIVRSSGIDLGIIAGARILNRSVIDAFKVGVINLHPGLIPEARGLDAMLWSIYNDLPLGVTTHLIDDKIDAGKIIQKEVIKIFSDDSIFDLSARLYEKQFDMLVPTIQAAILGEGRNVVPITRYNRKMPAKLERATLEKLPSYVRRFAIKAIANEQ